MLSTFSSFWLLFHLSAPEKFWEKGREEVKMAFSSSYLWRGSLKGLLQQLACFWSNNLRLAFKLQVLKWNILHSSLSSSSSSSSWVVFTLTCRCNWDPGSSLGGGLWYIWSKWYLWVPHLMNHNFISSFTTEVSSLVGGKWYEMLLGLQLTSWLIVHFFPKQSFLYIEETGSSVPKTWTSHLMT